MSLDTHTPSAPELEHMFHFGEVPPETAAYRELHPNSDAAVTKRREQAEELTRFIAAHPHIILGAE